MKVLPEAAGIVFGGGFPRGVEGGVQRAAQLAIFYVQRELEAAAETGNPAIVLCDRGTIDGLAHWPGPDDFWTAVGTSEDERHPRRFLVDASSDFLTKASRAIDILRDELPECCRSHEVPSLAAASGRPATGAVDASVLGADAARFDHALPERFPGPNNLDAGIAG